MYPFNTLAEKRPRDEDNLIGEGPSAKRHSLPTATLIGSFDASTSFKSSEIRPDPFSWSMIDEDGSLLLRIGPSNDVLRVSRKVMVTSSKYFDVCLNGPFAEAACDELHFPQDDFKTFRLLCLILHNKIRIDQLDYVDISWLPRLAQLSDKYNCGERCALFLGQLLADLAQFYDPRIEYDGLKQLEERINHFNVSTGDVVCTAKLLGHEALFFLSVSALLFEGVVDQLEATTDPCSMMHLELDVLPTIATYQKQQSQLSKLVLAAQQPIDQQYTAADTTWPCKWVRHRVGEYSNWLHHQGIRITSANKPTVSSLIGFDPDCMTEIHNHKWVYAQIQRQCRSRCKGCSFDFVKAVKSVNVDEFWARPTGYAAQKVGMCLYCLQEGKCKVVDRCVRHEQFWTDITKTATKVYRFSFQTPFSPPFRVVGSRLDQNTPRDN